MIQLHFIDQFWILSSELFRQQQDSDLLTITFYLDDNTLVTHRVVEIDKKNQTYTTKGDANEKEDILYLLYPLLFYSKLMQKI